MRRQNAATVRRPSVWLWIWRRHHSRRAWRLAGGPNPSMIVLPEMRRGAPGLKLPSAPRMVRPSAYGGNQFRTVAGTYGSPNSLVDRLLTELNVAIHVKY